MELILLWAKLIFSEGFAFHRCTAVWLFSPDPSAVRGRGCPCHAGGISVTAEQDRALWWRGHVGRHRESTVLARSAAWPWLLLEVWLFFNDEGSGKKVSGHSSLHHETAAVHFHLWASASHLSATNNVSVLSLKCLESSSVDGIRARQW